MHSEIMLQQIEEPSPDEVASRVDPGYWALINQIKLQSGTYSFKGHEYQKEPMRSRSRRICCMKGTQGGWTEMFVLRALHGMIYEKYPRGVLYMFPTTDDVREFSKSRFNTLISSNRESIGKYVKRYGKGTDSVSLKKVRDALLYLRGARLTQSIGIGDGEKESSKLRSIPVDLVVFDEVDLMDEDAQLKAIMRMGASKVGEEVYLSNPTLPDFGIDKLFQASDQRHLMRKCPCGHWTCAETEFPECVAIDSNGRGYIKCSKCGKAIGYRKCEWVPAVRDNTSYMHGHHWSQLSSAYNDPAEILEDFNNPPRGNLGDVYRLRLGLPYVAAEDRLSVDSVMKCCGNDCMPTGYTDGQCAMGVDVGKMKHIVIGIMTGKDHYEILKVARRSSWNDIHDLARKFNVKSAVIDIRPYEDEVRRFQESEKAYQIYLCQYDENTVISTNFNKLTGIVKVNRTEICDSTHRIVTEQNIKLPRRCPEVDEFAKQLCNIAKVLMTNKRTNTPIFRYRPIGSGGDHYRHALNYFYLATQKCRVSYKHAGRRKKQMVANNEYAVI